MAKAALLAVVFLTGIGVAHAQTQAQNCYPRIGAYSGQYEGQCPNSALKWSAVENTIGAYGRNCNDESWTYNRNEKMFYNHRSRENFAMRDCYEPTREQLTNNMVTNLASEAVTRFQQGRLEQPSAAPSRP